VSQDIIIIGNGIAGNSAAEAIRKFDRDVGITIISEERYPLYSPCAFYKYLAGEMEKEKLFLKKSQDYSEHRIKVIFGNKVSRVDARIKEVVIDDKSIQFDKLVLATGSKPVIPPIKGVGKKGIFAPKTIDDAQSIFDYPAKKVVVVGSGPIGIEMAIAFRKKGLEVSIIELFNRILPRLFDDCASSILRETMERQGIKILTEKKVSEIIGDESVKGIVTDGNELPCDMVIMAVGVKPNTELAETMGLEIGTYGGIRTDDYMATNMEDIYACGDCVEAKDAITSENTLSLLWPNAKRQGSIAGYNCAGQQKRFIGSINVTSLEVFGTYALSIGKSAASFESQNDYDVVERTTGSRYYRLIIAEKRLVGVQLINSCEFAGLLFSKMLRKDNLAELEKTVLDDELLSIRPWHYWIGYFMGDKNKRNSLKNRHCSTCSDSSLEN